MTKIAQLSDIGGNLAANDEFIIRDVSDASTPNKKVTSSGFVDYIVSQGTGAGFTQIAAGVGPLARVLASSSGATGTLTFSTASATTLIERARIDSSGRLLVGTSTANTSGAKLQTSDGLTFPATQVASSDPNTLDDYEEGTWTPTIVDSIGAAVMTSGATGFYTKIGNQVTLSFNQISWSSKGTLATAPINIAGFPFANRNLSRAVGQLNIASSGSFTLANRLIILMEATQSQAGLHSINATSNEGTAYSATSLGTSGIIYGMSLTYTV